MMLHMLCALGQRLSCWLASAEAETVLSDSAVCTGMVCMAEWPHERH
jgi:hypothetical protein